jgi:acetyl-CoA C-acetyltransferase
MKPITNDPIVFLSAARTPMGNLQGELSSLAAPELGAAAIRAALARAGAQSDMVDEVVFGCVLPAGQGQAPPVRQHSAQGLAYRLAAQPSTRCVGPACAPS